MSTRVSPPSPALRGRWLQLARTAWVAVAVAALGAFVISVPARYAQLSHPTARVRAALSDAGLSADGYAFYNVTLDIVLSRSSPWSRSASSGAAQTTLWRCWSRRCWSSGDH
jgi:hypothetical protein